MSSEKSVPMFKNSNNGSLHPYLMNQLKLAELVNYANMSSQSSPPLTNQHGMYMSGSYPSPPLLDLSPGQQAGYDMLSHDPRFFNLSPLLDTNGDVPSTPSFYDSSLFNHPSITIPNNSYGSFNNAASFAPQQDSALFDELFSYPSASQDSTNVPEASPLQIKSNPKRKASTAKSESSENEPEESDSETLNDDPKARKRRQNTLAARRSRQRKADKLSELEQKILELEKINSRLETKLAVMESELKSEKDKSTEHRNRASHLETQLFEALKASQP